MGKVEKVIVLSVLFLIALILVVSLTVDDPLNKSRVVEAGAPPNRANPTPIVPAPANELASANSDKNAPPLLSSQVTPSAGAAAPAPVPAPVDPAPSAAPEKTLPVAGDVIPAPATSALPPGALLKKLDGLQDSILPDMKLYTWKEGDSYRSIAQNYYGNVQKMTVLKRSNEGRTDVQPGQQIFVPVFDTDVGMPTKFEAPKNDKAADAKAVVPGGSRIHVVKDGESLWKIAKVELGNGDRWKEIYELNRDVLAKPEAVHKGQRLRIP
jgi:nucleoid-associated protein YgaU